tara:strand:+ start:328 stop:621 length:294 start_codon:yes stop_codon:yes gene_type:complete
MLKLKTLKHAAKVIKRLTALAFMCLPIQRAQDRFDTTLYTMTSTPRSPFQYPFTSLAEARDRHEQARKNIIQGIDPRREKQAKKYTYVGAYTKQRSG